MSKPANTVNWVEIPVSNLERATRFYESILDVKLNLHEMGPLKMAWLPSAREAPGAAATLIAGPGYTPSSTGTLVYLAVSDIDATLAKIAKAGGKGLTTKTSIGEWGFIARFEDSEGNCVALHANK